MHRLELNTFFIFKSYRLSGTGCAAASHTIARAAGEVKEPTFQISAIMGPDRADPAPFRFRLMNSAACVRVCGGPIRIRINKLLHISIYYSTPLSGCDEFRSRSGKMHGNRRCEKKNAAEKVIGCKQWSQTSRKMFPPRLCAIASTNKNGVRLCTANLISLSLHSAQCKTRL